MTYTVGVKKVLQHNRSMIKLQICKAESIVKLWPTMKENDADITENRVKLNLTISPPYHDITHCPQLTLGFLLETSMCMKQLLGEYAGTGE